MRSFQAIAIAAAITLAPAIAQAQAAKPGDAVLTRGRALYYSLAKHGFAGAQCQLRPEWDVTLGQGRTPQTESAFAILDQLRMTLKVGADGTATVEGVDPNAAQHPNAATGVSQIFAGTNQAFSGLFATWSLFMINSPLPSAGTAVAVTPAAGGYLIRYKDSDSDIETNLRENGEATRVLVKNAAFVSTILPRFRAGPDGVVLTDYQGDYTPTAGKGVVHLTVHVDYQAMSGMQFPSLVDVDTTVDGQPSHVRIHLEGCQVSRKAS